MQVCLPTGELIEVGDGGGRKIRKSSTGFQLKQLFMGHQGTLGITTEATLELVPRPEAEFAAFFGYPDYETAYKSTGALAKSGLASLAGVVLFDEWKVNYLRRDDEAYIPQPPELRWVVATALRHLGRDEAGVAGDHAHRQGHRWQLSRRRGVSRRLGVAPRPLCDSASRSAPRRDRSCR